MKYTPIIHYRHEDIQKKICDGKIEGTAAPYTGRDPPDPAFVRRHRNLQG